MKPNRLAIIAFITLAAFMAGSSINAAHATIESGLQAYGRRDFPAALAEWRPLAEAGDPRAQYYVGELHLRGEGVAPDATAAAAWYERAARLGHGEAQMALAGLYAAGLGVKRDASLAYFWMIQAAIGSDAHIHAQAFGSLAAVAKQLDPNQKSAIGRQGAAAWGAGVRGRR